jgi:hypothetical protein
MANQSDTRRRPLTTGFSAYEQTHPMLSPGALAAIREPCSGFAAKPGTEVLPTCSMATTGTPAAAIARAYSRRSCSNRPGHAGSYSATTITSSNLPSTAHGPPGADSSSQQTSASRRAITELLSRSSARADRRLCGQRVAGAWADLRWAGWGLGDLFHGVSRRSDPVSTLRARAEFVANLFGRVGLWMSMTTESWRQ